MSEAPKPVTVKLKRGSWEVEITCPEDRVRKVVEDVTSGLSSAGDQLESRKSLQSSPEQVTQNITPPSSSRARLSISRTSGNENVICRDLIQELWFDSWFESERNLSDVDEELARRGYHYHKTSISHSLADLVRENILARVGSMRNYRYIRKRPPS